MINIDLIKKIIEKFKAALAEIEYLTNDKKYDEIIVVIDATLTDLFRLNLNSFNSLTEQYLLEMLKVNDRVDADRCVIISILLAKQAEVLDLQGDENKSHFINSKALSLLLEAYLSNDVPELVEFYSEIPKLHKKIEDFEISNKINLKLYKYYEAKNNFSKAEDIIFDILDSSTYPEDLINEALSFYERISLMSDDVLSEGGLPREELKTAISYLNTKLTK